MPTETFYNLPSEKRELITEVGLNEFASRPYEVASLNNMVKALQIAKGSAYQYFGSKRELYLYLLEYSENKFDALCEELEVFQEQKAFKWFAKWLAARFEFETRYPLESLLLENSYRDFANEDMGDLQKIKLDELHQFIAQHFKKRLAKIKSENFEAFLCLAVGLVLQFNPYCLKTINHNNQDRIAQHGQVLIASYKTAVKVAYKAIKPLKAAYF